MNRFKLITMYFIPFLVFVGCGQSFEANSISIEDAETSVDANNIHVQEGETPKSVDQRILDTYMSEFNRLDTQDIEDLADDIRSFELRVDRRDDQISEISVRMHSRTDGVNAQGTSLTACDNLVRARDTHITMTQLESQESVFLGRSSGYEFKIQCTDSDCDEMVVAIRRTKRGSEGLVLMGLKAGSPTGAPHHGSYFQKYVSRNVDIDPYFTKAVSPDQYISRVCSLIGNTGSGSRPQRPSQPEDPSLNVPVDPTDGIFDL